MGSAYWADVGAALRVLSQAKQAALQVLSQAKRATLRVLSQPRAALRVLSQAKPRTRTVSFYKEHATIMRWCVMNVTHT